MPSFIASRKFFRPIAPVVKTSVKETERLDYAYGEEGRSQMEMPAAEPVVETVPEPVVETVTEPVVETVTEPVVETVPKKKNSKKKKSED